MRAALLAGASLAFCLGTSAGDANAGELTGRFALEGHSSYYFRGAYAYEHVPNLQPDLALGWSDPAITLDLWAAIPLMDRDEIGDDSRDEIDVTLTWDLELARSFTLTLGGVAFILPRDGETFEVFALGAWEMGAGFGLDAGVMADVDDYKGIYAMIAPGWSHALAEDVELGISAVFGMDSYESTPTRMTEAGLRLAVAWRVAPTVELYAGGLFNLNPWALSIDNTSASMRYQVAGHLGVAWEPWAEAE